MYALRPQKALVWVSLLDYHVHLCNGELRSACADVDYIDIVKMRVFLNCSHGCGHVQNHVWLIRLLDCKEDIVGIMRKTALSRAYRWRDSAEYEKIASHALQSHSVDLTHGTMPKVRCLTRRYMKDV